MCLTEQIKDSDNPPETSRTKGALFVINQCFKIFFAVRRGRGRRDGGVAWG
jgi:hypothetical protein